MDDFEPNLSLPLSAHGLAALPLPPLFPALPSSPLSSLGCSLSQAASHPPLHSGLTLSGAAPPLIHSTALPPLGSPCRACRALTQSLGLPSAYQEGERGGFELGDACAGAAEVRAWGERAAAVALPALQAYLCASPALPGPQLVRCLLLLAPLTCYAPFTHPALAEAAWACLAALGPTQALVGAHALPLLQAARAASAGGAWRAPAAAAMRYTIPWLLCRLPPARLDGECLALALPLALRLCDDWEATSVWCGLSALAALLATATPTALAPWAPVIHEALLRASAAGAATTHPTLAATLAHAKAAALAVLVGPRPSPALGALARAAARRGGSSSSSSSSAAASAALPSGAAWGDTPGGEGAPAPLFEGPWDTALAALLRAAARASSAPVLYALLHALPPYLAGAGALSLARLTTSTLLPLLARSACPEHLLQASAEAGAEGAVPWAGDARLPAAALHALHVLVLVLGEEGGTGAGAGAGSSSCSLPVPPGTVDAILATLLGALLCQRLPGAFLLPEAHSEEQGVPGRLPLSPSAAQLAAAQQLLAAHASALLAALRRTWPEAVAQGLAGIAGKDAELEAALQALP
jgi:hypothetical protein